MKAPARIGKAVRLGASESDAREVPCRDCGTPTMLSGFAWDFAKGASEMLMARGEVPLEAGELTRCAPCGEKWHAKKLETSYRIAERVTELVREVKAGRDLSDEQLYWLRKYGYGDTAEGMDGVMRKRREGGRKGREGL